MKTRTNIRSNIQVSLAGLSLVAALALAKPAAAYGNHYGNDGYDRTQVSGGVQIVRDTPHGTVTVGVEVGRPQPREVTVIRHEPVREVTVVRHEAACEPVREVTVIHGKHGRTEIIKRDEYGHIIQRVMVMKHGNGHNKHGRGAYDSYVDNDGRVYEARADEHGSYRYYEDDSHASIHEVRDGQSRNVYIQK